MTDHEGFSPAMVQSRELLQRGQVAAALRLLEQNVEQTELSSGKGSFEAALAHCELGALRTFVGDTARAVESYRHALSVDPGDEHEKRKRWLTIQGELASALEKANQTTEAEQVHLECLQGRSDFYGREHPGYAFGLEAYASFLARHRSFERAIPFAAEAFEILAGAGHPKMTEVLWLMVRLQVCVGIDHPFSAIELPDELLEPIAIAVRESEDDFSPEIIQKSTASFLEAAGSRMTGDSEGLAVVFSVVIEASRNAGDHASRRRYIERFLALCSERGEAENVQHLTVALGLAAEDDGDLAEAERLLREGVRLANDMNDAQVRCHALRQLGIFYTHNQQPEAERVLRAALLEALSCEDEQEAGLTRVALGIHLQHQGQLTEARELLAEAVAALDPASSNAFSARSHLNAIEHGGGCGCGGGEQAFVATLEALVRPEIPEGLLGAIELEEGRLSVRLLREPSEEEAAVLDRALRQALHRCQQANRAR